MSKPKLKAVNRRKSDDSYMHCCRWCHYYKNGKCLNRDLMIDSDGSFYIYEIAESGKLDEAIREALNTDKLNNHLWRSIDDVLMGWSISNKRRAEFKQWFPEILEQHNLHVQEEVSEVAAMVYQNAYESRDIDYEGVSIDNPEDFCCKHWC